MRKQALAVLSSLTIFSMTFAGCGSLVTGSRHEVSVTSEPSTANAIIYKAGTKDIAYQGTTPFDVELNKKAGFMQGQDYLLEVTKQGYAPAKINITAGVNGWYIAGNILFGGIIGWLIVDPATGGMWSLSPDDLNANLSKDTAYTYEEGKINIVLKEDLTEEEFEKLNPTPVN
jgi:hypothetical protein